MRAILACVALATGCSSAVEATWMEGGGFGWKAFNHRLSHLTWEVDEGEATVALIGGTSTSGVITVLDPGCEKSTCSEFPFFDSANHALDWGRVRTRKATFGRASIELLATADGASGTVTIPLQRAADGAVGVILTGLSLDTDHVLSGADPACYPPANGWHPRRIALSVTDAALSADGTEVTATVGATFAAGASLENVRQCIDDVTARAQVPITVTALAVVSKGEVETTDVAHGATYDFDTAADPGEQPDPDLSGRPLAVSGDDVLVGWSAVDFRFYASSTDDQGAYLRTLSFRTSVDGGWASGHATNYSPGTQLDGFEYAFAGTVTTADVGATVERGTAEALELPATVDDDEHAILTTLPL